jgi:phosphate transport system regulatory protein PhoU
MRKEFTKSLDKLREDLMEMGHRVDETMLHTIEALQKHDVELAQQIMDGDEQINAMGHALEQNCMYLITRQQPIARDLRVITSTLKAVTDIERIGDQCADISEIITRRESTWAAKDLPYPKIIQMFEEAHKMYVRATDSLMASDEEVANAVREQDDVVDNMFHNIVMEISSIMAQKPALASEAVDDIIIVKYIERIGDHATNIAEWTVYLVTGTHPGF